MQTGPIPAVDTVFAVHVSTLPIADQPYMSAMILWDGSGERVVVHSTEPRIAPEYIGLPALVRQVDHLLMAVRVIGVRVRGQAALLAEAIVTMGPDHRTKSFRYECEYCLRTVGGLREYGSHLTNPISFKGYDDWQLVCEG